MNNELGMLVGWFVMLILSLLLAPLMLGIINRVKAIFAGRHGQPLLQLYFDLIKLMQKGTVYSNSCSSIFRIGSCTIGFRYYRCIFFLFHITVKKSL